MNASIYAGVCEVLMDYNIEETFQDSQLSTCYIIDIDNKNLLVNFNDDTGTRRLVLSFLNQGIIQKFRQCILDIDDTRSIILKIEQNLRTMADEFIKNSVRLDWNFPTESNWDYRDIKNRDFKKNHKEMGIMDIPSAMISGNIELIQVSDLSTSSGSTEKFGYKSNEEFGDILTEQSRKPSIGIQYMMNLSHYADRVELEHFMHRYFCAIYPEKITKLKQPFNKSDILKRGYNPTGVSFLSHPHSDHCYGFVKEWYQKDTDLMRFPVLTRKITFELASERYSLNFFEKQVTESINISLSDDKKTQIGDKQMLHYQVIPSGHCIGANALITTFKEDHAAKPCHTFVAGEFRPYSYQSKYLAKLELLQPRKCINLVIDSTFGDPRYRFPPIDFEAKRLIDWIEDNIESHPLALYAYNYGKAQDLSLILHYSKLDKKIPIIFSKNTCRINNICSKYGFDMSDQYAKSEARKKKIQKEKPFILIVPRSEKTSSPIQNLRKKRELIDAEISGWCVDPKWREEHPADAYFTISGHPDYDTLKKFIKACKPRHIISQNGQSISLDL
ncbi:MAG: hypothetical protein GF364_09065 [Candidatus Lokiarchaeota archaeon]|nr:hypothetical protein [Candidatus Lokiarchaeota archaeon]